MAGAPPVLGASHDAAMVVLGRSESEVTRRAGGGGDWWCHWCGRGDLEEAQGDRWHPPDTPHDNPRRVTTATVSMLTPRRASARVKSRVIPVVESRHLGALSGGLLPQREGHIKICARGGEVIDDGLHERRAGLAGARVQSWPTMGGRVEGAVSPIAPERADSRSGG